jgi:hypothetical protein
MSQGEKIEIPSVDLLDRQRDVVNKLWDVSRATRVEPGWHYSARPGMDCRKPGAVEENKYWMQAPAWD